MTADRFAEKLLGWFHAHKRELPWRNTNDQYKIWLSEVLLQQTRVIQGLPYYEAFIKKYPTVKKLAQAPEAELLRWWQGLGYYSRARNLHRCAKIIAGGGGKFPETADALMKLPGIGDYTAAAIASFAFKQPSAVVDGNVFRVLSRLYAIDLDISSPAGKKHFFALANTLISKENPGEFNQGLMEFGALHCTPRNPQCETCVFAKACKAYQAGTVQLYPVKAKAKARKVRHFNYFVFRFGNKTWMQQRNENDIWQGLYEFYLVETNRAINKKKRLDLMPVKAEIQGIKKLKQILSHQQIEATFFEISLSRIPVEFPKKNGKFYSQKEIEKLAKPVIVNMYLQESQRLASGLLKNKLPMGSVVNP